ncbi:MAG: hypothetical protein N3A65_10070 [candidate division WOR-3 bacterium]|nr:hypothetical protein [candidate division WOR-3 bacterium]
MNNTYRKFLGDILITLGVIMHKEVFEARWVQMNKYSGQNKRLGEIMIELGYITNEDLNRALSLQRDLRENGV